jgi:Dirigent-like protein
MHDILGGTNPSARIVAGIVDDVGVSSQLPFARPNGAVLPLDSNVNVNNGNDGAINNNNIPFLTGLGGTTNAFNTKNGNGNANGVPFFAGGSLPEGTTLQKLLFGTMTVIDDELTEGPELGSGAVGKAQVLHIPSFHIFSWFSYMQCKCYLSFKIDFQKCRVKTSRLIEYMLISQLSGILCGQLIRWIKPDSGTDNYVQGW